MTRHVSNDEIDILLVEDNPGDIRLTQEMLKEAHVANRLEVVTDGEQALDYLFKRAGYRTAPRPGLVLLDLNLPKKSGLEVLEEVKAHPELRRIPIVILTTSKAEEDIVRSYNAYANCYVTKPVDLAQFMTVVRSIEDFWLTVVKLPRP
jgi:CheY-like chemotaxis protein